MTEQTSVQTWRKEIYNFNKCLFIYFSHCFCVACTLRKKSLKELHNFLFFFMFKNSKKKTNFKLQRHLSFWSFWNDSWNLLRYSWARGTYDARDPCGNHHWTYSMRWYRDNCTGLTKFQYYINKKLWFYKRLAFFRRIY